MASTTPSDPSGVTGQMCNWVGEVQLQDIPDSIKTLAKYLILDGVACALVGTHLPWSETAARAVFDMEGPGNCTVIGWERKLGPNAAALLNSAFVQGFELDDVHCVAPIHSNSVILSALLAASEHSMHSGADGVRTIDGPSFLLAAIVGYEIGPRVGLSLHGGDVLARGWHSGVVFGHAASAAAVSKLLSLSPSAIEDAIGIACTQACGLMSAQFESMAKRMQHGFAARNGLFAAFMANGGYTGIQRVFERSYGGFLSMFSQGCKYEPPYDEAKLVDKLGAKWEMEDYRIKAHAAMAGLHGPIDCISVMQEKHPEQLNRLGSIRKMIIEMSKSAFNKGAWKPDKRTLTALSAQMNAPYAAALQLVDRQVLMAQFSESNLNRDILWELMEKTDCVWNHDFDKDRKTFWATRVTVDFADAPSITEFLQAPVGITARLSNEEIKAKWRLLTEGIIDPKRRDEIETMILNLEDVDDVTKLAELLSDKVQNRIA